jgi:hypothetical protein
MRKHQPESTLDRKRPSARSAATRPVAKERSVPISAAFDPSDLSPLRIVDAQFIADQEISQEFFERVDGFTTSILTATADVQNFQGDATGSITLELHDLTAPRDPLSRDRRLSLSAADIRRLHAAAEAHAKSRRSRSAEIFNEELRQAEKRAITRSILESIIDADGSVEHVSGPLGAKFVRGLRSCIDALRPSQSRTAKGRARENDDVALFIQHASLRQRGYSAADAIAALKRHPEEDERELRRRVTRGRKLASTWGISPAGIHAGGE